jgi:hypothetical protein
MFEAALICMLCMYIQFKAFTKNPYSDLQNNPKLNGQFQKYYSKRKGKYRALDEAAYYNVLAKQAKSSLIGFFCALPIYFLLIVLLYPQLLG